MNYLCPVCGFAELRVPPSDFSICPSCGTEFGYDDSSLTHEQLRNIWIASGAHWFAVDEWQIPQHWNPFVQLAQAGLVGRISGADTGSTTVIHRVQGPKLTREQVRAIVLRLTSEAANYKQAAA
jgi:hypothetical protein